MVGTGRTCGRLVLLAVMAPVLGSCNVGCLVGGCGDPGERYTPPVLRFTVTGRSAALAVGDSGTARVEIVSGQTAQTQIQWSLAGSDTVVALDPASATSARVRYRAVRAGTGHIRLAVLSAAQAVVDTAAVTVTVR